MRRLYWETRKACKASSALELKTRSGVLLVKDDRLLNKAGITGPTELLLRVLPHPDTFTVFVKLPGHEEQSTIAISEVCCMMHTIAAAYFKLLTTGGHQQLGTLIHLSEKSN